MVERALRYMLPPLALLPDAAAAMSARLPAAAATPYVLRYMPLLMPYAILMLMLRCCRHAMPLCHAYVVMRAMLTLIRHAAMPRVCIVITFIFMPPPLPRHTDAIDSVTHLHFLRRHLRRRLLPFAHAMPLDTCAANTPRCRLRRLMPALQRAIITLITPPCRDTITIAPANIDSVSVYAMLPPLAMLRAAIILPSFLPRAILAPGMLRFVDSAAAL